MSWLGAAFWIVTGSFVAIVEVVRRRRLAPMLGRGCAGGAWRRAFPGATKGEIREFLKMFVDCFAVRRKHALAFQPGDRILRIYEALNPPGLTVADAMEFEMFGRELEKRYAVSIEWVWREDLTLGEVFGYTKALGSGEARSAARGLKARG